MNFTWGSGAIAASATDFAGVTWTGRILSEYTETYEVELGTAAGGDAGRLWIDGLVVIDGFERGENYANWDDDEDTDGVLGGGGTGFVNLTAGVLHDVTIEYRCVDLFALRFYLRIVVLFLHFRPLSIALAANRNTQRVLHTL